LTLTIAIATRGRPGSLRKTVESMVSNATIPNTTIMVCVDEDDAETLAMRHFIDDKRVLWSSKPREDARGEKYDRALTEAPADVYLLAVDCVTFHTKGFDEEILKKAALFEDGIGCVYTPMANASFPGFQAPTAKLVEKIGYTYNHEYPFWFIDHELDDICRMIGRFVFANVKTEHQSMRPGTTIRLRDLAFWTTYFDCMELERRAIARRIILSDDFVATPKQKAILCNQYQLVESRSRNINAGVRHAAAQIEAERGDKGPPDEGYLRAKAAAEAKLETFFKALKAAA